MHTLLFIDDDLDVLSTLKRSFRKGYNVLTAENGEQAKLVLDEQTVNLIICDQRMPGITGDQVLQHALQVQPDAIRILLTGYADMESLVNCVNEAQIYKYVSKPWDPDDLRLTVVRALEAFDLQCKLDLAHAQLKSTYHDTVNMLCSAAEGKDKDTASHLYRVQFYTEALAIKAGIPQEEAKHMGLMSILHDIGKLSVPDAILQKPGKLTEEEWTVMRRHPTAGAQILGSNPFYEVAREIAACHHENYDGTGYPNRYKGNDIPLSAQIVKIADVFDALTTKRPYKEPWTINQAMQNLVDHQGSLFSPILINHFVDLVEAGSIDKIREHVKNLYDDNPLEVSPE